jgi:hypothetical protein
MSRDFRLPEERLKDDWVAYVGTTTNDPQIMDNIPDPRPSVERQVMTDRDAKCRLATITSILFGPSDDSDGEHDIWWRQAYAFQQVRLEDKPVKDVAPEIRRSVTTVYRYLHDMDFIYDIFDCLYLELEDRLQSDEYIKRILHYIRIGRGRERIRLIFERRHKLGPAEVHAALGVIRTTFIGILKEYLRDPELNPEKDNDLISEDGN